MLYERWRKIALDFPKENALRDLASGRAWTFRELALETEQREPDRSRIVFPRGAGAEFVLSILRAWRNGRVICPLENEQSPPDLSAELPPGTAHVKTTSATSGSPRLIAFTASQLMADAEHIVATMGLRPDW